MTAHLLLFSVGPVAEFVEASRRTRDLHFSSWLVSEMARQAAQAVLNYAPRSEIISPQGIGKDDPINDRILVLLPESVKPTDAALASKAATQKIWKELASQVFDEYGGKAGIDKVQWDKQSNSDLVEFCAAWTPLADDDKYPETRSYVENLLNARKTFNDLSSNACADIGIDKSSLDGRRESVIIPLKNAPSNEDMKWWEDTRSSFPLKLSPGEELDLPGFIKRTAKGDFENHFASVSRIAANPWIQAAHNIPDRLKTLNRINNILEPDGCGVASRTMDARFKIFPWDGQVLYPSRLQAMEKAEDNPPPVLKALKDELQNAPHPENSYLAVLACDGDNMTGKTAGLSKSEHISFSRNLSAFGREAKTHVENAFGSLVYAGGDDVLAFLPLDKALSCATELRKSFRNHGPEGTLSVGIAIVHMLTPMVGDMVRWAYEAEGHAKHRQREDLSDNELADLGNQALAEAKKSENNLLGKDRGNALAIHLHKRSGAPISIRLQWDKLNDNDPEPTERMNFWVNKLHCELLPDGAAYQLHRIAQDFTDPITGRPLSWVSGNDNLIRAEVARLLKRKRSQGDELSESMRDAILNRIHDVSDVNRIAREIIIARAFVAAVKEAEGGEE